MLDYDWLKAKLNATSVMELVSDFVCLDDEQINQLKEAIRLSSHVLATNKNQLVSQLYGRLLALNHPILE